MIRTRILRRNGKWVERHQLRMLRHDSETGKLRKYVATFDVLDDAIERRTKILRLWDQGEDGVKRDLRKKFHEASLGKVLQTVLDYYKENLSFELYFWKRRSHANENVIVEAFKSNARDLCKKSLGELTQADIQRYVNHRLFSERKRKETVKREMTAVRHAIKLAKEKDWYPQLDQIIHLFRGLEWGPKKEIRRPRHILTPDEWFRLLKSIHDCSPSKQHLWTAFVIVGYHLGLRRGELLKIEWRDIENLEYPWNKGVLNIRAEITKDLEARRLPLTEMVAHTLSLYRSNMSEDFSRPTSKVFGANYRSGVLGLTKKREWGLTETSSEQAWRDIIERAKIFEPMPSEEDEPQKFRRFSIHELRHNATTRLRKILTGEETAYVLGHADPHTPTMTAWYVHIQQEEMCEKIRAKLQANEADFQGLDVEYMAIIAPSQKEPEGLWQHDEKEWEWVERKGHVIRKRKEKV
jgi:integrase